MILTESRSQYPACLTIQQSSLFRFGPSSFLTKGRRIGRVGHVKVPGIPAHFMGHIGGLQFVVVGGQMFFFLNSTTLEQ